MQVQLVCDLLSLRIFHCNVHFAALLIEVLSTPTALTLPSRFQPRQNIERESQRGLEMGSRCVRSGLRRHESGGKMPNNEKTRERKELSMDTNHYYLHTIISGPPACCSGSGSLYALAAFQRSSAAHFSVDIFALRTACALGQTRGIFKPSIPPVRVHAILKEPNTTFASY